MIKDGNKVVLLTIFLYIALNLKTIESFLQKGHIVEPFTAVDNNEKTIIIIQGIVKCIIMLLFAGYYMLSDSKNGIQGIEFNSIMLFITITTMILIFSIVIILIKSTELYNTTIYVQSFLKPMINLMYIYALAKIVIKKQSIFVGQQFKGDKKVFERKNKWEVLENMRTDAVADDAGLVEKA